LALELIEKISFCLKQIIWIYLEIKLMALRQTETLFDAFKELGQ
jgi:hypothetical protein